MIGAGLLVLIAQVGWWPIHLAPGTTLEVESWAEYDDNLFRYSPETLREFEAGIKPYRFPHRTRDDLHTTVGVSLRRSFGRGRLFRFTLRSHTYALNPQKSYTFYRFDGRFARGEARFALYGYLIPAYLVRYFPELDSTPLRWRPALYRASALGLYGQWPVGEALTLRLEGRGKWWDYVAQFNEYDTWALWGRVRLAGRRAGIGLGAERAWARATDQPGENPLTSDDPDYSYQAYEGEGWVRLWNKPEITLRGYLRLRQFVTRKPFALDPYHAGRKDRDYRVSLTAALPLNRRLQVLVRYRLELRRTTSPALPQIFEVKDYTRHRLALGTHILL